MRTVMSDEGGVEGSDEGDFKLFEGLCLESLL